MIILLLLLEHNLLPQFLKIKLIKKLRQIALRQTKQTRFDSNDNYVRKTIEFGDYVVSVIWHKSEKDFTNKYIQNGGLFTIYKWSYAENALSKEIYSRYTIIYKREK